MSSVHKFGGTSVNGAEGYRRVLQIITQNAGPCTVVVSAMAGVTNDLLQMVEMAARQDSQYLQILGALAKRHEDTFNELELPSDCSLRSDFKQSISELTDILKVTSIARHASEEHTELVAGHGEIWSAQILNTFLNAQNKKSHWINARDFLTVRQTHSGVQVVWEESQKAFNRVVESVKDNFLVIPGYVARREDQVPTTLKRNGSDWSAAIVANLLEAKELTIWTDVDGVLSADPRVVSAAYVLPDLSYAEASELAYFGAKVLHPKALFPAAEKGIPTYIRNSFRPEHPGTKIHSGTSVDEKVIKGLALIDHVALINLEGTGMQGIPGIAQRLFAALHEEQISVILISQGSSEQSICLAVPEDQGEDAKASIEKAFFSEIHFGQIEKIGLEANCSVVAAVGDGMVNTPGVAARFFQALANAHVNVKAIAQGSSERNISIVIDHEDRHHALRAIHSGFTLSHQVINIGLIGPGLIGKTLLEQLKSESEKLKNDYEIDLKIRSIAKSKDMVVSEDEVDLQNWESELGEKAVATDLNVFTEHLCSQHSPHKAIIDCTSSDDVSARYVDWLQKGIHVITPNKKAGTASFEYYENLFSAARENSAHFLYETTVGAGLPIIHTLRELMLTGDRILSIEGIFSGTLSYIFNSLSETKNFSSIVSEAKLQGLTEPDPRDDLSGMDVARKVVILAREAGKDVELSNVHVENLVPSELRSIEDSDAFMQRLGEFDQRMELRRKEADEKGNVLRYVGKINASGEMQVALEEYPKYHAFARIQGTDNIVSFTTERYKDYPLIVQGPGAGPQVTAAGVFADLLRLSSYLGGKR